MPIRNSRDFWSGVLFTLLGTGALAMGSKYALGTAARMGPGYFPRILGILLIALLFAPRAVDHPARYAIGGAALGLAIVGGPLFVESLWPVSVDSAAWLYTLVAAVGVQAVVEARRRLRLRARVDAESGLPNRSVLEEALAAESGSTVVYAAAIERFETIRDGIGLAASNEMISNAAEAIAAIVQGSVYRIAPDVIAWTRPDADEAQIQRIQSAF